jgi:hypothetical protein
VSIRLDALAYIAVGVRQAAFLAGVGRHVAIGHLPLRDDPLGALHAGKADVDHI